MRLTTLIAVFVLVLLATFALGFMLGAQARSALRSQQAVQLNLPTPSGLMADLRRQQQMIAMAKAQNPFVKPATSVESRLSRLAGTIAGPTATPDRDAPPNAADAPSPPNPLKGNATTTPAPANGLANGNAAAIGPPPAGQAAPPTPPAPVSLDDPTAPLSHLSVIASAPEGTMARVLRPPPSIAATETAAAPLALPATALAAGAAAIVMPTAAYSVEVARTEDSLWAQTLVSQLLAAGEAAYLRHTTLPDGRELTYVRVGVYPTDDDAQTEAQRLFTRHGLNTTVLRVAGTTAKAAPSPIQSGTATP